MSDQVQPNVLEKWAFSIAAKKVTWALIKLITSVAAAEILKKYGVVINTETLGNVLPGIIFSGLVAVHDYLKVKTNWKWL